MIYDCTSHVSPPILPDLRFASPAPPGALMAKLLVALMCAALTLFCGAREVKPGATTDRSDLAASLTFEAPPKADMPGGWGGGPG